ncbi:17244_t:CDS:2, partial [Racocetra fulgida]
QTIEATGVQPGNFMIDADLGLEKEQFTSQFAAWHEKTTSYMTPSVPGRLFLNIYNILQKYITPKILQLYMDQMNEAVMYYCKKVDLEDLDNLTLEVVNNGPIKL